MKPFFEFCLFVFSNKKKRNGTDIKPPPIPKRPAKKPTGEAAKTFYDLKKGRNFTVLNMEVRFKGDFTAQPQFQATLAKDFVDLLHEKCKI